MSVRSNGRRKGPTKQAKLCSINAVEQQYEGVDGIEHCGIEI